MKRLENLKLLEKELEDLEGTIFRSDNYKPYLKSAVNYRMDIWEENFGSLPVFVKLSNGEKIRALEIRALSIRSVF